MLILNSRETIYHTIISIKLVTIKCRKDKHIMNNITIVGRLTKDIEIKNGAKSSFGVFSIADRKDKDTTRFFNCTVFGKLADVMSQYTKKGDKVAIQGELDTTTKDNTTYYNVLVNNFEFCESKKN